LSPVSRAVLIKVPGIGVREMATKKKAAKKKTTTKKKAAKK
jgi:hypothetical protein